jgi:hypothetical protein
VSIVADSSEESYWEEKLDDLRTTSYLFDQVSPVGLVALPLIERPGAAFAPTGSAQVPFILPLQQLAANSALDVEWPLAPTVELGWLDCAVAGDIEWAAIVRR